MKKILKMRNSTRRTVVRKFCIAKKEKYLFLFCFRKAELTKERILSFIQMAADKLGQRRCSNHVDSAVKNIVTTSNYDNWF